MRKPAPLAHFLGLTMSVLTPKKNQEFPANSRFSMAAKFRTDLDESRRDLDSQLGFDDTTLSLPSYKRVSPPGSVYITLLYEGKMKRLDHRSQVGCRRIYNGWGQSNERGKVASFPLTLLRRCI
jgi:hypothetical protein